MISSKKHIALKIKQSSLVSKDYQCCQLFTRGNIFYCLQVRIRVSRSWGKSFSVGSEIRNGKYRVVLFDHRSGRFCRNGRASRHHTGAHTGRNIDHHICHRDIGCYYFECCYSIAENGFDHFQNFEYRIACFLLTCYR